MGPKYALTLEVMDWKKREINQYKISIDQLLATLQAHGDLLSAELSIEKGGDILSATAEFSDYLTGFFIRSGTKEKKPEIISSISLPDQEFPCPATSIYHGKDMVAHAEHRPEKPTVYVDPDYLNKE